ncbi:sigma-54-dependent Fis family transcriptional regulator [Variovorax sp. Root411]|uniref:sigma-54-dependent Fis family transcriptional regulator n=1 Tax=Variovorax sp. Root411 TaxID=1736530 RepID=UPI0006FDBD5B|nr:sigma-54-dependent Fis family transcriptional regulator [Variovorax sp. Root411]KQW64935.1 hypothetical protein ASC92_05785 [Variovorax sp. Root411]
MQVHTNAVSLSHAGAIAVARQAFFETGAMPQGQVDDAVLRSWVRCRDAGRHHREPCDFSVDRADELRALLERERVLCDAAAPELERLGRAVAGAGYAVLLTNSRSRALAVVGQLDRHGASLRAAFRPGVDLSENAIGTNAMSNAVIEGRAVRVFADEHFFAMNGSFHCLAAPVFDPFGHAVGSVDVTRDTGGASAAPLVLVQACAQAIERRLFERLEGFLLLRLGWHAAHSAVSGESMLAFGPDGELLALDRAASALLSIPQQRRGMHFNDVFEDGFAALVGEVRRGQAPASLRLQDGVLVFAQSMELRNMPQMPARTAAAPAAHVPEFGDASTRTAFLRARTALDGGLPILLAGETGTGKEVAARALHAASARAQGPFVAINCAAVPAELIEAELFGHAEGAFTGARRGGAMGKIEAAHRGTLFLDEIGDMPLHLQAVLLGALERREVTRLGSLQARKVDLQLICASHRPLQEMVALRQFREDLYFRLAGYSLRMPPLRERGDLDLLVDTLLVEEAGDIGSLRLEDAAREALLRHAWPGNVRELRYAIRHARAMAVLPGHISLADLPEGLSATLPSPEQQALPAPQAVAAVLAPATRHLGDIERQTIEAVLIECEQNMTLAARRLGIGRATLYRKVKAKRDVTKARACATGTAS